MRDDDIEPGAYRDLTLHGLEIARVDAAGAIVSRAGAMTGWIPAADGNCFAAPLFAGLEDDLRDLRAGRQALLALPNVGWGGSDKANVTISWDPAAGCYTIVAARAFGASETEIMLVRERRERRLADEQAEAARRRANVNEALYRDIVESGSDIVLRLTPDRRIAFANTRALALAGRAVTEMLGADVGAALPVRDGAEWSAIAGREEISFEQQFVAAGGELVWIWWRAAWLGRDGGPAEYQVVGRDITLLKKLQADIERANIELRAALVMRERLKIAHDLHDTIVHALVAVVAQLRLVRKLARRAPERVDDELATAETAAREGLERGRAALGQVRFQRAGVEGLAAALDRAASRFTERTGVSARRSIDPRLAGFSGEQAEIIFRIAEEALRNVESHANATSVTLSAELIGNEIEVVVGDDGRGFDPARDNPGHYGLQGMDEQARMIGGRLAVTSEPGRGATLVLRAPVGSVG
ncbi:MAG: PAS domain-containing protein [Hyphomicrobiales bacterium]|nr:PAS domain-containing protein [Hyphomicrobiales bacterium]